MDNQQHFSDIEFYEDKRGISDILDGMPPKDQARFFKKTESFKKLPFYSFVRHDSVEFIPNYKGFYEIKYKFSSPPYRAIAFIQNTCLVLLLVFKGSGSGGNLNKHLVRAVNRANDWKNRY